MKVHLKQSACIKTKVSTKKIEKTILAMNRLVQLFLFHVEIQERHETHPFSLQNILPQLKKIIRIQIFHI